jgi:ubiquinone/menaquinone biosynthesis C-methylase UbiE
MQNRDDYQNTAAIYDFLFSRVLKNIHETIRTCLAYNKAKNVIDLCCGTGQQLRHLTDQNMTLTGVDLSQAMLYQARKKSPEAIHYLETDAGDTQLPTGKYDGVIITFALHEKPESEHLAIFEEACKLLAPNGVILIADYCVPPEELSSQVMSNIAFQSVERLAGINHYHCYKDWMANGAVEGFLDTHNPGKLSLISEHYFGCVKLLSVSNIPKSN